MTNFATARQKMVDGQVLTSDVTDHRILDAMLALPREMFVPAEKQALAYLDLDLDVGGTGTVRRYLLKPMLTAKLLQAAGIQSTDTVLTVGCATGYMAALAARLAGKVTATESDTALAARAKDVLSKLGFQENVSIEVAEAAAGSSVLDQRHCAVRGPIAGVAPGNNVVVLLQHVHAIQRKARVARVGRKARLVVARREAAAAAALVAIKIGRQESASAAEGTGCRT